MTENGFIKTKKGLLVLIIVFAWTALFFLLAEIGVRLKGVRPWSLEKDSMEVEPQGKFFKKHPTLGYSLPPGEFKITFPQYTFKVTHSDDGLRITHPIAPDGDKLSKEEIWIFGCSYAYGWSLNDEETFPWLLQEKLSAFEIVNFGVPGYSNLQSLIQFQEALKSKEKPKIVVLTYASFQDERNTCLRSWRKTVVLDDEPGIWARPLARIKKDGKLEYFMEKVEYKEFPLMRHSAFMHFLEDNFDRIEDRFYHSHEVSKAIVEEFSKICKKNNIEFIVAGMTSDVVTYEMLEYCKKKKIESADMSIDVGMYGNLNLPFDKHPGLLGNRQFAENLEYILNAAVLNKK